jgi:glycosyltransferase involved in cell wall biosynthesis
MTADRARPAPRPPLALAYFGSLAPDAPRWRSRAFSPAGHLWQRGLLGGLCAAGVEVGLIRGFPPFPAYPGGPLLVRAPSAPQAIPGLPPVALRGYLNLPLLKVLAIGAHVALELRRWARRNADRTRVALLYNLSVPPAWLLAPVARSLGVHLVASLNDMWLPGTLALARAGFQQGIEFRLRRYALRRLSAAIVVSDAIATDFVPGIPHVRVEGGVFPEQLRAGVTARDELRPFTVGLAGTLEPYNGVREFLAAAEELAGSGVRFRIAGDGSLAGEVIRRAAASEAIDYAGALELGRMGEFYGSCDLLVNWRATRSLDLRYVFPSKILELLASGVPVLSTRMGQTLSGFGGHMWLSEDESVEALVAGVRRATEVGREQLRAMGEQAAAFMAENFTWRHQGMRVRRLLEQALGVGPSRDPHERLGAEHERS